MIEKDYRPFSTSNEEFKKSEGVTPETEELMRRHILPDALEDEEVIAHEAEVVLPDRTNPEAFQHVLETEGIAVETEQDKLIKELLDASNAVYKKITDLIRGKISPHYDQANAETSHIWDVMSDQWVSYKKNQIPVEEIIGMLKMTLAQLAKVQKGLEKK